MCSFFPRGERWQKFISQPIEPAFSKYRIRHVEPDILIRVLSPQKNTFWISVSGWKLTIRPDIHPANRIGGQWSSLAAGQSAASPLGVTGSVATAVFFARSGVILFYLGFLSFSWKSGVFWLWSNFKNVCCFTVFSIQEYSSFTCIMCRVSSQYSWVLSRTTLNYNTNTQIVWNLMLYRISTD